MLRNDSSTLTHIYSIHTLPMFYIVVCMCATSISVRDYQHHCMLVSSHANTRIFPYGYSNE